MARSNWAIKKSLIKELFTPVETGYRETKKDGQCCGVIKREYLTTPWVFRGTRRERSSNSGESNCMERATLNRGRKVNSW